MPVDAVTHMHQSRPGRTVRGLTAALRGGGVVKKVRVLAGRYRLEERLGGGGMSVVWRAYDEKLGRAVAVKVMSSRYPAKALPRERIRGEAEAAARLSHPRIAKVHDYGESGGTPFIVMELLEGQTLAQRLRAGPVPVRAALEICAQVAGALAAAHARGLVHRDIKPANIMLTPTGAILLDFGIAATMSEPAGPAQPARSHRAAGPAGPREDVWGTPAYIAPERLTKRQVVPASDVYALGLLLYRMLTGELPWPVRGTTQMLTAHLSIDPAPLPADAGVSPRIAALCHRCLAKDPRHRPTAREMAEALFDAVLPARRAPYERGSAVIVHGGSARPRLRHAARRRMRTRLAALAARRRPARWAMPTRPRLWRAGRGSWRRNAVRLAGSVVAVLTVAVLLLAMLVKPSSPDPGSVL